MKKNNIFRIILVVLILFSVGYYVYNKFIKDETIYISLSEAIELSKQNIFSELVVESEYGESTLYFTVAENVEEKTISENKVIKANDEVVVDAGFSDLKDLMDLGLVLPAGYEAKTIKSSNDWSEYITLFLLIGLLVFYYVYSTRGSAEKFVKNKNSITFNDIGGISEIKNSLMEVVGFLKNKSFYNSVGARTPRGILLEGAPGVGKTMLAQAIATEAGLDFYYATGSEFHDKFVGMAALRIKRLFNKARKTPSVIFIDEFDSVAHARESGGSDVNREWNHTLNQLLAEMDGFDKSGCVTLVIAATNRADVLDPAVLRPGRFDRKIVVPMPSQKDRTEILSIHLRNKPVDSDVNLVSVAKQTIGFSGADLALLVNEAAIIAGHDKQNKISMKHIDKAIDKVLMGDERKGLTISKEDKNIIAYHEAGHALLATILPNADRVQYVSILPRGSSGGMTRTAPEKEQMVLSKDKALDTIAMCLGGRIAEEMVLGLVTSGAQNDLQRANELAKEMVEHYGMSEKFGLRYVPQNRFGIKELSIESQKIIDEDVSKILNDCYKKAKDIIAENRARLEKLATKLLEVESLTSSEVNKILLEV